MAVTLQSATREKPAPCDHFFATINIDLARQITVRIRASELTEPVVDDDLRSVLNVWARYQRSKGKTIAQLIGGVIFQEIV